MRTRWLLLLWILLLPGPGLAGGTWLSFTEKNAPLEQGFLVGEYSGTVTVTFLGDCTLGGEESMRRNGLGYWKRIADNGPEFPFRFLSALTREDDISVANLEGVLTDRALKKVEKRYNFSGPTAYTDILTSGGIDCVTLANNHSHDYGEEGYRDTKAALSAAGVRYFGTDCMAVWRNEEGLMIGFTGVSNSLSGNRAKRYARQVSLLREMGCAAVISVMHAGTEYSYTPDAYQAQIVQRAMENGVDLVIGHHPHVVQGYRIEKNGLPVVYSLGNCSFGGTTHAKDSDALIVQADLHFEDNALRSTTLRFFPISITSDPRYNNYSPALLTGRDAERVLKKMQDSTGFGFGPFDEQTGAPVECPKAE